MKKFFYFLLVALPFVLVSCDDDDEVFPRVKMSLDVSGVTIVDGTAYVVQGDTFKVNDVMVAPVDSNANVVLASVSFFWDRMFVGSTVVPPFYFAVKTYPEMEGKHVLKLRCSLLSEGYSPAIAVAKFRIKVVDSIDDIPEGDPSAEFMIYPEYEN